LSSAKEKQGEERSEKKEKKRKEIHISRVMEVRSLNLDLDLLGKDLRVKL
jgi:hypothetical protein